ncbi:sigma factor [Nonomuraea deserti]|uniref:sigma factor n=1 Tax=Nonomuraea deserti TaxID=1848322 RepID=UPI001FE2B50C|nr:sigma factor [Nonomuraea deserti]
MEGDPRFAEFVAERGDALLRYGYVLAGNPHDAADLVQEALLKLRGAWHRLRPKENPESYVRTTMARLHIAAWRLRGRERLAWDPPEREHHDALPSGDERTMNDIEETLRRTLSHAAEQAPHHPGPLPARLERVHRRRRRRARTVLAAAAIVLVAGGTTAVLRGGDTVTAVQGEAASLPSSAAPSEHVEKVWPEAVRKVPAKGPGGAPSSTERSSSPSPRVASTPSPLMAARSSRSTRGRTCICCPGRGSARGGREATPKVRLSAGSGTWKPARPGRPSSIRARRCAVAV